MKKLSYFMTSLMVVSLAISSVGCATKPGALPQKPRVTTNQPAPARVTYPTPTVPTPVTPVRTNARLADDIARSLTKLSAVQSSSVVVTDKTAYVGVTIKGTVANGNLTNRVKKEIADQVRAKDPSIQRVHVSANPNFVKQMNNFATSVRAGRPISGLYNNLMDVIRRTFPTTK